MITGINHITLSVKDLEASYAFYTEVLGCRPVAKWPKGAYMLAGEMWLALIMEPHVREQALPEYTHIAFTVSPANFETMVHKLQTAGVQSWQENRSEGASFYFTDPNGHKLEIHVSDLAARL
ncbi:MAG: fosfomycin resistance glutathione transferase, partial [Cyanobacteria bacterium J06638_22]